MNGPLPYSICQGFRLQTRSMTEGAELFVHVFPQFIPNHIRLGFMKPSVQLGNNAFEPTDVSHDPSVVAILKTDILSTGPVKDGLLNLGREIGKWSIKRETIVGGDAGKNLPGI